MQVTDFIRQYKEDNLLQTIGGIIRDQRITRLQFKGIAGSLDAVIAAALYSIHSQHHIFILPDREEAAYFQNDLQSLLQRQEVLLFPTSYKKPYLLEETENANILMRTEVLGRITNLRTSGELIVTYPEALTEKLINKRTLNRVTFSASVGEQIDIPFLQELLATHHFEKTDFVFEPGQYSVRGGIIDIYSFASDLPYRVELFGDEIETIRTFDPISQLSKDHVKQMVIIPNINTEESLLEEERQSLMEFLPEHTIIWLKDYQQAADIIESTYKKAEENFNHLLQAAANTQVVLSPSALFDTRQHFTSLLDSFTTIEFGNRFYFTTDHIFRFEASSQPSFNKNFEFLVENLHENQAKHIHNIVSADSEKQIERLRTIFEELDHTVSFEELPIALRAGFIDKSTGIACYTEHQIFERFYRYKTKERFSKSKALTLKELKTLQPGDYVTHVDYGIGRFTGLEKVDVSGRMQEAIRLVYRDDDLLYISIHSLHKISKYSGKEDTPPVISKLGSPDWDNKKKRAKKKVKELARDLIELYAKRKAINGFSFQPDSFLQAELESSFIYEDTPDQARATADVKEDMQEPHPMDRLICGDVGFGKTEIAIRAAFKAVAEGKQVAILVPTTILALQHYRTLKERLANFPVTVEYINRFKSTANVKEALKALKEGKVNILIGTHRLVGKDVAFKDLGLLIIDEEQKFGVKVKEKLKEFKVNVDTLTLTATPIPRTLHFSLMGARDLSIISTPPPNRQPVSTEIHTFSETIIRDAVSHELRRSGQVFFVHNRVANIEEVANTILRLVPDARIGIAHGQLEGAKLEKVMMKFIDGDYDVLVSTNIIESGLDIPNANTIIINNAHMFGLSDLHQMRGRVGRSNKKAYCYLLSPPASGLSSDARKRLRTLEEFSELGDGFKVAMRDLDIRGAGNLLGTEQSGFITDLGFEMYHKILDETVQELKENEFKELFTKELRETNKTLVRDCNIETDLELIIPETYVSNISERLSLYSQLDNLKNEEELSKFEQMLSDRFGPLPDSVQELMLAVRVRWLAETLGFEKLVLKNGRMKGYFVNAEDAAYFNSDTFGKILQFVQKHPKRCVLKETQKRPILSIQEVSSIHEALDILRSIER
jgi:transcription-repair coupling factor (superfamily II helicase)